MRLRLSMLLAAVAFVPLPGAAQDYKIGISAGLTGYAATVDRAWRDGVEVAAAALNAKGGIMGRKLTVIAEDNRSELEEVPPHVRRDLRLRPVGHMDEVLQLALLAEVRDEKIDVGPPPTKPVAAAGR